MSKEKKTRSYYVSLMTTVCAECRQVVLFSFFFLVAFRIYDIDQDGFISNGELFQVLKTMVGNNLTEKQLQEIVDKTILYADKDGDGKISYEEFSDVSAVLNGGGLLMYTAQSKARYSSAVFHSTIPRSIPLIPDNCWAGTSSLWPWLMLLFIFSMTWVLFAIWLSEFTEFHTV